MSWATLRECPPGCLRSRLPDAALLRRLGQAAGPAELLVLLTQEPGWRSLGRSPGEPVAGGRPAVDDLVDRWRATRLGALLGYYEPPVRRLVEALVLPLDAERLVALLRWRRAGQPAEAIARTLSRGALLDAATLAWLAGMPTDATLLRALGPTGVVSEGAAAALGASAEAAARPARRRNGRPRPRLPCVRRSSDRVVIGRPVAAPTRRRCRPCSRPRPPPATPWPPR